MFLGILTILLVVLVIFLFPIMAVIAFCLHPTWWTFALAIIGLAIVGGAADHG